MDEKENGGSLQKDVWHYTLVAYGVRREHLEIKSIFLRQIILEKYELQSIFPR